MSKNYKYASAHAWFADYVTRTAEEDGVTGVLGIIRELVEKIDGDTIQDLYQSEMDDDGFFDVLDEEAE